MLFMGLCKQNKLQWLTPWIFVRNDELELLLHIFPNPAKPSSSIGIFAGAEFLLDFEQMLDSGWNPGTALVFLSCKYSVWSNTWSKYLFAFAISDTSNIAVSYIYCRFYLTQKCFLAICCFAQLWMNGCFVYSFMCIPLSLVSVCCESHHLCSV